MDVRVVEDAAGLSECLRLRAEVFIGEQNVSEAEERDGLDDECVHFLATAEGVPIGAARLNYLNQGYAKIQRVCVVKAARGTGAGAEIIRAMIAHVRADGRRNVIRLGAQTHALAFYEKLGFVAFGDEYPDAGIPHFDMEMAV